MPIKYIGKSSSFKGKTIFEILGNLKNFGVGRVVVRSSYLRYPEPSYYRIVKVEPEMDPENKFGCVWAEVVFRGVKTNVPTVSSPYVKDFQLLSKEEEKEYCKILHQDLPVKLLPSSIPFPPLFKELIMKDMKKRGEKITEEPLLPLIYCEDNDQKIVRYRKVEEGEMPTVEFDARVKGSFYDDVYSEEVKDANNVKN